MKYEKNIIHNAFKQCRQLHQIAWKGEQSNENQKHKVVMRF